jgi:uncharacterized protein (TIGR03437 family)
MFGMHINNLALPNSSGGTSPYPPPQFVFHALRLHDAGVTWAAIETARGVYDWTRLDDWVQLSQNNNYDLMLTVEDTPQWASSAPTRTDCQYAQYGDGGCAMPANIQDYVDFLTALVARYKGKIAYYEGWNEANTGWVAPGARKTYSGNPYFIGTQQDLVLLQQNLYQVVKAGDPAAKVSSPPFVDLQQGITDVNTLLAAGACSYFDILGFHYYTQGAPPEIIPGLVQQIGQALTTNGCGAKPLWDTETGWNKPTAFPAFSAPGILARTYILASNAGIQRLYWYAYNNTNFDTFFLNQPLDYLNGAAYAYENLQTWLIGATITGCSQDSTGIYTCTATDSAGKPEWFVWYAGETIVAGDTQVPFSVPSNWYSVVAEDINGNRVTPTGDVWVGPDPIRFSTAAPPPTVNLSSASYSATALAPASLAVAYGQDLATKTESATSISDSLGGTTVSVTDSSGASTAANPIYVSPGQVNYYLPPALASGNATVTITSGDGTVTTSTIVISSVAPGLFTEGQLQGPPAAVIVHFSGSTMTSSSFAFSCSGASCATEPIDVSQPNESVYLYLYGTGIRGASNVTVNILGTIYPAAFAAQQTYVGLDQVNVLLPASLAGAGTLPIVLIADSQISNTVHITIQ